MIISKIIHNIPLNCPFSFMNNEDNCKYCSYCAELNSLTEESYFLLLISDLFKNKSRYLFESKDFIVFPSVGTLVPGHVLVVPKRHTTAMAYLDKREVSNLKTIIQFLSNILGKIYDKNIICMEHGAVKLTHSTGICVDHAHIHLLPTNLPIIKQIHFKMNKIGLQELRNLQKMCNEYILVSQGIENLFFSVVDRIPSQFLRKIFFDAEKLSGDWNWREDQRINLMQQTINDINQYMNEYMNKNNTANKSIHLTARGAVDLDKLITA